jgi:hypothetical protein
MLCTLEQHRVWDGLLGAEIRSSYFAELCGQYHRKQKYLTWALLVFSSGALGTLIRDWLPIYLSWLPAVLALGAVGLSLWSLLAKRQAFSVQNVDRRFFGFRFR